ncbi:MAG: hypothetical protein AAAFM81_09420 [Pseudomonadota bacterium]
MKRVLASTILALLCSAGSTQGLDEIVVTGSRISPSSIDFDAVPVVHIERRPDFMVVSAFVESDSRRADLRRSEVNKTLANLAKRAENEALIELGLLRRFETGDDDIEYVIPFSMDEAVMVNGYRADTSRVNLVVKSPVRESDASPDEIYERIEAFLDEVSVNGRAVVSDTGDTNFSLVKIAQYREPLLRKLADETALLRSIFGDEYHVSIGGFDETLRWRTTGPMTLAIYFPYSASIAVD